MQHEQLDYFDALRYLAGKYHIEIRERELTDEEKAARSDRESLFIVNHWAQRYFTEQLWAQAEEASSVGLRYFLERGFRPDTIRKFQLGYSPDERDALYKKAIQSGYRQEFLEKTGLIIAYENGKVSDRFRARVMFPVHTLSGKVVAFGGRILRKDDKAAKYMNSPESEIYHKGKELYGLFLAKGAIVKADRCYLVEGYTDVISMHQAGIENVVASSGTALTLLQIRLLRRFTENITVLYDGDAAGIKAALRGIDLLLEEGLNVKVALLPDGEDPDSFARSRNATEFAEFIRRNETDFIRFKTRLLLADAANDPLGRAALINDVIRTIALIPDGILRALYIRECSSMMDIGESDLLEKVNRIRLSREEKRPAALPAAPPAALPAALPESSPAPPASPFEAEELALLRYVVRYGERILYRYVEEDTNQEVRIYVAEYIRSELEQDEMTFLNPLYRKMLEEASAHCREEGFVASKYFLYHAEALVGQTATDLISEKYQLSRYHTRYREIKREEDLLLQLVPRDLLGFKDACVRQKITAIGRRIKELQESGDWEQVIPLMREQDDLNVIKKNLNKMIGERIILKM
jgi:DNA primase